MLLSLVKWATRATTQEVNKDKSNIMELWRYKVKDENKIFSKYKSGGCVATRKPNVRSMGTALEAKQPLNVLEQPFVLMYNNFKWSK